MSMYISVNTPSAELDKSPIDEAITFMATHLAVEKRNGRLPQDGPMLDVTFKLSTADDAPPFTGMRMGGYTDENNTLYFETAVPAAMCHSPMATRYVTAVLQDVVTHATEYFAELKVPFAAEHWNSAVNTLAAIESNSTVMH